MEIIALDEHLIGIIVRALPSAYHARSLRATCRYFMRVIKPAPRMTARAMLEFAAARGFTELCMDAYEHGMAHMAKLAGLAQADDTIQRTWYQDDMLYMIRIAAKGAHIDTVIALISRLSGYRDIYSAGAPPAPDIYSAGARDMGELLGAANDGFTARKSRELIDQIAANFHVDYDRSHRMLSTFGVGMSGDMRWIAEIVTELDSHGFSDGYTPRYLAYEMLCGAIYDGNNDACKLIITSLFIDPDLQGNALLCAIHLGNEKIISTLYHYTSSRYCSHDSVPESLIELMTTERWMEWALIAATHCKRYDLCSQYIDSMPDDVRDRIILNAAIAGDRKMFAMLRDKYTSVLGAESAFGDIELIEENAYFMLPDVIDMIAHKNPRMIAQLIELERKYSRRLHVLSAQLAQNTHVD